MGPSLHDMFNPVFLTSSLQRALQSSLQGHADQPDITFLVTQLPRVLNYNCQCGWGQSGARPQKEG